MQVNDQLLIILNTVGVAIIGLLQYYQNKGQTQTKKVVDREAALGHEERARLENHLIVSGKQVERLSEDIAELIRLLKKFTN